jgi:hypothetical protein
MELLLAPSHVLAVRTTITGNFYCRTRQISLSRIKIARIARAAVGPGTVMGDYLTLARRPVRQVLRADDGTAEPGAGSALPVAAGWLL